MSDLLEPTIAVWRLHKAADRMAKAIETWARDMASKNAGRSNNLLESQREMLQSAFDYKRIVKPLE